MQKIVSLPAAFQANGYKTVAFGKRHLFLGCDEGWDVKASHMIEESLDDNYVHWVKEQGYGEAFDLDWAAEFGRGAGMTPLYGDDLPFAVMTARESKLPGGMTMEAWTKRRTVDFINSRRSGAQPFG